MQKNTWRELYIAHLTLHLRELWCARVITHAKSEGLISFDTFTSLENKKYSGFSNAFGLQK